LREARTIGRPRQQGCSIDRCRKDQVATALLFRRRLWANRRGKQSEAAQTEPRSGPLVWDRFALPAIAGSAVDDAAQAGRPPQGAPLTSGRRHPYPIEKGGWLRGAARRRTHAMDGVDLWTESILLSDNHNFCYRIILVFPTCRSRLGERRLSRGRFSGRVLENCDFAAVSLQSLQSPITN
jgi:hypothetical protein